MRHTQRWLLQDQATPGLRHDDASAARLTRDGNVIGVDIVATQGQVEAVLPGCGSVACAGVATNLSHHGNYLIAEAGRGAINRNRGEKQQPAAHQNSSSTGSTPLSTSRVGRPCNPGSSVSSETPSA